MKPEIMECGDWSPLFGGASSRAATGDESPASQSAVKPAHSKTCRLITTVLFLLFATVPSRAQSYSIDWHTIDGGGGTSTGGSYTLSGTIGQPDAGTLSGGSYTLQGGFWPGLVVPSTGEAPTLFIQFSGVNVIVSWSLATPGFALEQTDSLAAPLWSAGPAGNPTSPIPAGGTTKFYRLRKP